MQKNLTLPTALKALIALLALAMLPACGKKQADPVSLAQAAQSAEEAERQNFLMNFAAAEKAYVKATDLAPDNDDYWFNLAVIRVRLNDKSGARSAYKKCIAVLEAAADKDPKNIEPLIKQLRPYILLGRTDDARALLDKAIKQFPADQNLKQLKQQKFIDAMLADPTIKQFSVN